LEEQVVYFAEHFTTICPVPIQVSPVVSNTCNLKCVMCPYHSPAIRPTHRTPFFQDRTRMSWDLMDRLATECGEMRAPVKMGNVEEPLIHPEIIRFVHACRARGVPGVHITSNGQALTEGLSRQLLEAGLTSLYVSVDASRPETYLRIRGASLERIEANVRSFLRVRKEMGASCSMMLSFVRNKGVGEDEAAEFREKWLGEGANGVIFYNLAEYQDGDARFERVHQVARSRMDAVGGRWPCLNPFQEIYALPDGRIYYCCETVSKLAFESLESMGAYPAQSLRAIWQGPAFTALRRDLIRNEIQAWPACRTCGIWMAHVTETVTENGRTVTRNMITEIVRP
jgi:MoaA/NifB/PqqE/SkfB family radical SAM enzyme